MLGFGASPSSFSFFWIFLLLNASSFPFCFGKLKDGPMRTINDVWNPYTVDFPQPDLKTTSMTAVKAEVVVADYSLLRTDFPSELSNRTDAEIDQWLIEHTAFFRSSHFTTPAAVEIHAEPLQEDKERTRRRQESGRRAFVPEFYGRGVVMEVPGGLVDIKGNGAEIPSIGDHKSGVMACGHAVREFLYEKAAEKIIEFTNSDLTTVSTYAILRVVNSTASPRLGETAHLDDSICHWLDGDEPPSFSSSPSSPSPSTSTSPPPAPFLRSDYHLGLVIRQSSRRCGQEEYGLCCTPVAVKAEKLFREFGLTSANCRDLWKCEGDPLGWEYLPTQCSAAGDLIDFGSFTTRSSFQDKWRVWVDQIKSVEDREKMISIFAENGNTNTDTDTNTNTGGSPQPHPCFALDLHQWGDSRTVVDSRICQDAFRFCSFSDPAKIRSEIFTILGHVEERWKKCIEMGLSPPKGVRGDLGLGECRCEGKWREQMRAEEERKREEERIEEERRRGVERKPPRKVLKKSVRDEL